MSRGRDKGRVLGRLLRERWLLCIVAVLYVPLFIYGLWAGARSPADIWPQGRVGATSPQAEEAPLVLPTSRPVAAAVALERPPARLDLNHADAWMLTAVPGIGQELAGRIVAYRQEVGGFTYIEELKRVSGIGEKLYEQMLPYVEVAAPEAVEEEDADRQDL